MTPRYEEHPADPALADFVHCTWLFEGDEHGVEQAVPPDGRCELIAHGRRPYDERSSDGDVRRLPALSACRPSAVVRLGRTPVPFRLVESGARRAVFANPEHVFPARILYGRDGDDLLARIEGTIKDQSAALEWRFAKGTAADCPSAP
jgi:uncharacterized protein DUF6597